MGAEPEAQVSVVTARDVELVGPLEDGLVAVGRSEPGEHDLPGLDVVPADLGGAGGAAGVHLDG